MPVSSNVSHQKTNMPSFVSFSELLNAYEWVSGSGSFENAAYINRATGKVYIDSEEVELDDDLPGDYEDGTKYIAVPHKNDLDLGRDLVFQFIDQNLPQKSGEMQKYFRERGAYSRFKNLLERSNLLEYWYKFEAEAVEGALREWAKENGIDVGPAASRTAG